MAGLLLTDEQRQQVERFVESELETLRRRARLLLLYDNARPTREVAAEVGLSRSQARYWKHLFLLKGIAIFPALRDDDQSPVTPTHLIQQEILSPGTLTEKSEIQVVPTPLLTPEETVERKHILKGKDKKKARRNQAAQEAPPAEVDIPFPEPLTTPGITAVDALAEATRKILLFNFAEMLCHEEGTRLGQDIEELHDMRVATRRLRAAFDVLKDAFDPKQAKHYLKGLRATGRMLGHARDMDVLVKHLENYRDSLPEENRHGLNPLLEAWELECNLAHTSLREYLSSENYHIFKREFNLFVHTPALDNVSFSQGYPGVSLVRDILPVLIYSRLASVRAYDTVITNATIDQLHALRIEFKRFRYTIEYFREVLGEEVKQIISELKGLQDHLGELHDAALACQLIQNFMANWEDRQTQIPIMERKNTESIVVYLSTRYAERHHLMVTFPEAWVNFNRPDFMHNLAMAVAVL